MMTDKRALELWRSHCDNVQQRTVTNPNESPLDKQTRIDRAKRDYSYFVSYYFPHYAGAETPDFHIDLAKKVKANTTIKALVRWGRGLAKSVVCDLTLPIWLWINGEHVYVVLVGNNEDKAQILLGDLQAEFESNQRLIHDFDNQVTSGSWTQGHFVCKERFVAKAIGMGQDARGLREKNLRPTLCICDDLEDKDTVRNPMRQDEVVNWILSSLIPTMDGRYRRFLMPNNNFAPRTIQSELEKRNASWLVHRVDASVGPERKPRWASKYPLTYYKELEQEIGTIAFDAEYNNRPFIEGKVFTAGHIDRAWQKLPRIDTFEHIVGRWDPAYSGNNDYNAVRVWGLKAHRFYLIASFVRQCKMNRALDWTHQYNAELPPSVIVHWKVEAQFWNDPMRDAIMEKEREHGCSLGIVVVPTPKTKKLDRLLSVFPYYENGKIVYNEKGKQDPDFIEGNRQLLGIEPGYRTHDDSPDADERAISDLVDFDRSMAFSPLIGRASHSQNNNY